MSDALFEMGDFDPKPVYDSEVPLGFTTAYFDPKTLVDATRLAADAFGPWPFEGAPHISQMWSASLCGGFMELEHHDLYELTCDTRCKCQMRSLVADRVPCSNLGDLLYQSVCTKCRWHYIGSEQQCVAAWHDHAFPGWRELPVVPLDVRPFGGGMHPKNAMEKGQAKKARAWVDEHYPDGWGVDGAPVVTEREALGTRSVPGYSPWGGYDISESALEVPL